MLASGDVDNNLDPGYSYYQYDFILDNDLHRTLYRYKPNDTTKPSPDLAEGEPTIASDGKDITIKIKKGVKFSPPVNREVKAADVKYAMERDFLPQVGNGYANSYWPDIVGVKEYKDGKAKEISGITTPDDYTLNIKLTRPVANIVVGAMALPGTAPVPKEYAAKMDAGKKSDYGPHLVTTGPYMVQNDASGKVTGYQPGRRITLVRNPNWDKSTDWRPAYLDKIIIQEGEEPAVGNRKVLAGQSMVANPVDLAPTPLPEGEPGRGEEGSARSVAVHRPHALDCPQHEEEAVRQRRRPQGGLGGDQPPGDVAGLRRHGHRPGRQPHHSARRGWLRRGRRQGRHRGGLAQEPGRGCGSRCHLSEEGRLRQRQVQGPEDHDGGRQRR